MATHAQRLAAANRAAAQVHALLLWRGGLRDRRSAGASFAELAAQLEGAAVPTAAGGRWHKTTVARLVGRAEELEAELGADVPLLTWWHVEHLRSALRSRRREAERLHPRHRERIDRLLAVLPERPEAAGDHDWTRLEAPSQTLAELVATGRTELEAVYERWAYYRETPERRAQAKTVMTAAHEELPVVLAEALRLIDPSIAAGELVSTDVAAVVEAWLGSS